MENDINRKLQSLLSREPRYTADAYAFVSSAVNFTVGRLPAHRHVSALELLEGAADFSRQEFGPLRQLVLNSWGILDSRDIGELVYLLISEGILSASPDDDPEDFRTDFDLFAENEEPLPEISMPLPVIDRPEKRRRRRS